MIKNSRRQVEKLLEVKMPSGIRDLQFFRWQPNPELYYYHGYIKFSAAQAVFTDLMADLGMHIRGRDSEAERFLPGIWEGPPDIDLPWWDPTADTPDCAAASSYGVNGRLTAKYENGFIYITLSDTGHDRGTPGPW